MAHGLSCSVACGIFPDQGLNPCPVHWQVDSQPLHYQRSPTTTVLILGDFKRYLNGTSSSLTLLFLDYLSYNDMISATQSYGHRLDLGLTSHAADL